MVPRTTASFRDLLTAANDTEKALRSLGEKAAAGDKEAAVDLFEKQLALNRLDVAEATRRLQGLDGVAAGRREALGDKVTALEVSSIMQDVTRDPATHAPAGARFAAMVEQGREPKERMMRLNCWYFISVHAEKRGDVELFSKAVAVFKSQPGIRKEFLDGLDKRLAALKEGAQKKSG